MKLFCAGFLAIVATLATIGNVSAICSTELAQYSNSPNVSLPQLTGYWFYNLKTINEFKIDSTCPKECRRILIRTDPSGKFSTIDSSCIIGSNTKNLTPIGQIVYDNSQSLFVFTINDTGKC